MAKILTVRSVAAARPDKVRREIPDAALPGLHLVVQPSGARSWAVRYRIAGKSKKYTLGSEKLIDLAAARAAARRVHEAIAAGEDPALTRRRSREVAPVDETFETIARRFIERHAKLRNRRWRETERILGYDVIPRWGSRPLTSITRADVIALLDGIVDRGSPATANRTRTVVRRMFNWCIERGTLETSPCDRVKAPAPEVPRDRVHSDVELALIWQASNAFGYPFAPCIRLLILTGQRLSEVAGLRWSELDPTLTTWTLPKERSKNGKQHSIPIVPAVREILIGLPRIAGTDFMFTSTGKTAVAGFSKIKRKLDHAIANLNGGAPIAPWVMHDFRRSAASGMARLGVALPVVEKILNHTSGSFGGVAGVYQKHDFADEKRDALGRWSQHVLAVQP